MAIYKIVYYPDPVLLSPAETVTEFNNELHQLLDDMFETMYHARGVGLAAPQIGISKRIAVIDASQDKSQQLVMINPEILETKDHELMQEGCLSVPGPYDYVKRPTWVRMQAQDKNGNMRELEGEGLLAEAMEHETQHLEGKLFIDLLSPFKRQRAKKKLEKFKRLEAKNKSKP